MKDYDVWEDQSENWAMVYKRVWDESPLPFINSVRGALHLDPIPNDGSAKLAERNRARNRLRQK